MKKLSKFMPFKKVALKKKQLIQIKGGDGEKPDDPGIHNDTDGSPGFPFGGDKPDRP